MSWEDRLKEAAITTPDGKKYIFEYEDVSKTVRKKTSKYTFGDASGALVQDFGIGEVGFPLTIYFSGIDYDLTAKEFELSAGNEGACLLEHPIYGVHDVIIEGWDRADNLKTKNNQAVFTIVMTETIIPAAPVSAASFRSNIETSLDDVQELNAEAFTTNIDNIKDKASLKDRILSNIDKFNKEMKNIKKLVDDVNDQINSATAFINNNIDDLLSAPIVLANSIQTIIRAPARVTNSIKQRINAYTTVIDGILNSTVSSSGADAYNQRLENQMFSFSLLSAAAECTLNTEEGVNGFVTRADATSTVEDLTSKFIEIQNYVDTEQQESEDEQNILIRYSVPSGLLSELKNVISLTASQLIKLAFSLRQERIIYNERPDETIITLCKELYGGKVEDPLDFTGTLSRLDFLILSNNLTGEELIQIPYNREIRYYA